jgi:hypothetical protein
MLLAPQRLKPHFLGLTFGTTEVVPFPVVLFVMAETYYQFCKEACRIPTPAKLRLEWGTRRSSFDHAALVDGNHLSVGY